MTPFSPVDIAQTLIRCPSVTPHEGGALSYAAGLLADAGFTVHRLPFSQAGTPEIDNLYARWGDAGPCLLFAGHTDVVPPGDAARWTHDPFSGTIENSALYGRGAVDMKGGVACMLAAALNIVTANPPRGAIAFLLTGDEEGPAVNGTVKVLKWMKERGERFDHCLLGEPTNPETLGQTIKIGRRGSLTGHLTVHGKQGHVAYPDLALNPITGLMRLIHALKAQPLDTGTAHFAPSNLEITTIDVGNPAVNVIPAQAQATFNIRFNDVWSPQTLEAEIRRRLHGAAIGAEPYTISFLPTNAVAFLTKPDSFTALAAAAIEAETGLKPALSTTGGTSDARFIKDVGPVLEFGLVGQTMHQVNERVAVQDLETLTAIYTRILKAYFA